MSKSHSFRDIAVISVASHQTKTLSQVNEVQLMADLISRSRNSAGLQQEEIGFTCSGSSDFLAGQAFSFVHTLDAVGAVPPISESHVEMDGAFALYEAWVKLQIGEVDTALVYSYGKPSAGSVIDVLATQLDPYYVSPLWPDCFSLAGLQARSLLDKGSISLERMSEVAMRSQKNAFNNPNGVRSSEDISLDALMNEPVVADPLRKSDLSEIVDGGCAVVLAADKKADSLCERPAWIKGIDHRIDSHTLGARDLTRSPSACLAAEKAGINSDRLDIAEIHGMTSAQELILEKEFNLGDETKVNPSGGALAADTVMASGLIRIAEVASRIISGQADRGLAHATSGPCLQQNLVCIMEGK